MDKLCDLKIQIKLKLKFVHLDWVLGFLWSDLYGFSQFGLLRQFRALIQLILDTLNKEDKKKAREWWKWRERTKVIFSLLIWKAILLQLPSYDHQQTISLGPQKTEHKWIQDEETITNFCNLWTLIDSNTEITIRSTRWCYFQEPQMQMLVAFRINLIRWYVNGADRRFGFRRCSLWDSDSEHTILHSRLHLLQLGILREPEAPQEAPLQTFHPVPSIRRACLLFLALPADLQHVPFLHLHLHFLLTQTYIYDLSYYIKGGSDAIS